MPDNGQSRLDRIESALEAIVRSQAHLLEAQTSLEREHKNVLTSQILMQEELRQFAAHSEKRFADSEKRFADSEKRFERIETNLAEAADKLNALIALMDRARPGARGQSPMRRLM